MGGMSPRQSRPSSISSSILLDRQVTRLRSAQNLIDDRGRLLCRNRRFGSPGENDIDLEADKLGRDLRIPVCASLAPAVLDSDGAALDPAKFAQPLHECVDPGALAGRPATAEISDGRHLRRLLSPRREWPRWGNGVEYRNEITTPPLLTSA